MSGERKPADVEQLARLFAYLTAVTVIVVSGDALRRLRAIVSELGGGDDGDE